MKKSKPNRRSTAEVVSAERRCNTKVVSGLSAVLAIIVAICFSPVISHDFINYDDGAYVVGNAHVRTGLSYENIRWAFTAVHSSNWHPVTWLSHMVDCEIYGLNPKGHHLSSLVLHVLNSVLLFITVTVMTGCMWRSWFVAILFGIHPLHVESVAWIAERKDVLSTFFGILTILFYSSWTKKSGIWRMALVVAAFALGLMAKPMLVTIPCVLLLLDYWPLSRLFESGPQENPKRISVRELIRAAVPRVREKFALFALAGGSCVMTVIAQSQGGAVGTLNQFSIATRINNAIVTYAAYLAKTLWPHNLSIFYPHGLNDLASWKVAVSAIVLTVISAAAILMLRKRPYFIVGWLWFVGTLVPVVGFVQVGDQSMADRYTYIPLIGFFIVIVWLFADTVGRWPKKSKLIHGSAGILVVGLCGLTTFEYVKKWKNSTTLFTHVLKVTTGNYLAHYNLAIALDGDGKVDEAKDHYQESLRINSNQSRAHYNLAFLLNKEGDIDGAVAHYKEVVRITPGDARAHNNLGSIYYRQSDFTTATVHYKAALSIDPGSAQYLTNVGVALHAQGLFDQAIDFYSRAIEINPNHAPTYNNLGSVYRQQGQLSKALELYERALQIEPGFNDAKSNIDALRALPKK